MSNLLLMPRPKLMGVYRYVKFLSNHSRDQICTLCSYSTTKVKLCSTDQRHVFCMNKHIIHATKYALSEFEINNFVFFSKKHVQSHEKSVEL